jgi:hypothetical protein
MTCEDMAVGQACELGTNARNVFVCTFIYNEIYTHELTVPIVK